MKSEGDCYSIDDLRRDKRTPWGGVRNYQARNFMRDDMCVGDLVLFYHSNGDKKNPSGVYGIAQVASKPHADQTALDSRDDHYDPKSTPEKPIWECVDVAFVKKFAHPVSLDQIKFDTKLAGILVTKPGTRLSIMPVSASHFERIVALAEK